MPPAQASPAPVRIQQSCNTCTDNTLWELRFRRASSGMQMFAYQCLLCGEKSSWIAKSRIRDINAIQEIDDSIRAERYQRDRDMWESKRAEESRQWWENYNRYLQSQEWLRRRMAVLKRAQGRCEARVECDGDVAEQVHHTSYAHLGNEPMWELRAVCKPCHDRITEIDRARTVR